MAENLPLILIVVALILLLWFLSRNKRPRRSNKLDTVIALLSDIDYDLKVTDIRITDKLSTKNFKIYNWYFNKDRMEFLDPELVTTINEAFTLVEELKNKIDVAKKNKALESLQDLQVERLKEPLSKSRKGLAAWLKANVNTEMQTTSRRNWLGF